MYSVKLVAKLFAAWLFCIRLLSSCLFYAWRTILRALADRSRYRHVIVCVDGERSRPDVTCAFSNDAVVPRPLLARFFQHQAPDSDFLLIREPLTKKEKERSSQKQKSKKEKSGKVWHMAWNIVWYGLVRYGVIWYGIPCWWLVIVGVVSECRGLGLVLPHLRQRISKLECSASKNIDGADN